ncbi:MAG: hypothetical protein CR989_01040 [Flavobacteriales bacterium]|nr:MAG: hypothetical protein CR989_01040 [Flavobacteriales bacterium]
MAFRNLTVFKKLFVSAMKTFKISKESTKEETCLLTNSDAENSEFKAWLMIAFEYREKSIFKELIPRSEEIDGLISSMINNPDKFGVK